MAWLFVGLPPARVPCTLYFLFFLNFLGLVAPFTFAAQRRSALSCYLLRNQMLLLGAVERPWSLAASLSRRPLIFAIWPKPKMPREIAQIFRMRTGGAVCSHTDRACRRFLRSEGFGSHALDDKRPFGADFPFPKPSYGEDPPGWARDDEEGRTLGWRGTFGWRGWRGLPDCWRRVGARHLGAAFVGDGALSSESHTNPSEQSGNLCAPWRRG